MEFRTFVSVVDFNGRHVGDLTGKISQGRWTRKLSGVSESDVTVLDVDDPVFSSADFMTHSLRFEVEYVDGVREIVWEGPIIVWPKRKGSDVLASDLGVFWESAEVMDLDLRSDDSAFLAERMLSSSLAGNPLATPSDVRVFASGYSSDLVVEEGAVVADSLASLVGLSYCFVGKELFLFSVDGLDVNPRDRFSESLVLDDSSFLGSPTVEQIFKLYANSVTVVGGDSVGVAESDEASEFRISKRFEFPEIYGREQVQAKAEELLLATSRMLYINTDNSSNLDFNGLSWRLSDLVPGRKASIVLEADGNHVSEEFLIDSVEVDVIKGSVSVGFIPFLRSVENV